MFLTSNNGGCIISPDNGSKVGLKAQKLLAQGIALGIMAISKTPCKGVLDVTYDTPSFCLYFYFFFFFNSSFGILIFCPAFTVPVPFRAST